MKSVWLTIVVNQQSSAKGRNSTPALRTHRLPVAHESEKSDQPLSIFDIGPGGNGQATAKAGSS
jgi:hypothetical protein